MKWQATKTGNRKSGKEKYTTGNTWGPKIGGAGAGAQEKQDDNEADTRTRRDRPNKSEVTTQA